MHPTMHCFLYMWKNCEQRTKWEWLNFFVMFQIYVTSNSVFSPNFFEIKWESISQVKNFPAYFKSCKNFKGRLINVILFSPWYFLLLLRSMMKKELLFAWFKFKKPPFGTKGVFLQADSPAQFIFLQLHRL